LLHRYSADRSHVLDLGIKINEATNFTILMLDQRGHAQNPAVKQTSFGGCETEDVHAAIDYLRGLKTETQMVLVGQDIGIYGVEMGALAALSVAAPTKTSKPSRSIPCLRMPMMCWLRRLTNSIRLPVRLRQNLPNSELISIFTTAAIGKIRFARRQKQFQIGKF